MLLYRYILSVLFLSFLFNQGLYIDNNEQSTIYSLNSQYSIVENNNIKISDYSFGFSTIINANNEISFDFNKGKTFKSYISSYVYYIRPNLLVFIASMFIDFNKFSCLVS